MNGKEGKKAIEYYPVSISIVDEYPGATQTAWYAKPSDKSSSNTYRNVLLRLETPIFYNLGTLVYELNRPPIYGKTYRSLLRTAGLFICGAWGAVNGRPIGFPSIAFITTAYGLIKRISPALRFLSRFFEQSALLPCVPRPRSYPFFSSSLYSHSGV